MVIKKYLHVSSKETLLPSSSRWILPLYSYLSLWSSIVKLMGIFPGVFDYIQPNYFEL